MTFMQWYGTGFVLFWTSVFIKQIFYWCKGGRVRFVFNALESKWDWKETGIISLILAILGPGGLFLIWYSVLDIYHEHKHQVWCKKLTAERGEQQSR